MVNDAMARLYWPKGKAVGKHVVVGLIATPMEVVGVLGDTRNHGLAFDPQPEIYLPLAQLPGPSMTLIVRTASEPHNMVSAVHSRVLALDQEQPVTAIQTMEEVLETAASEPRFMMSLLSGLSAVALLLALVGIYGVIAYSVSERTQEMGIRMALGADRGDILWLVLRQGAMLAGAGIVFGIGASFALTRLLGTMLYRVSTTDPITFTAVPLLFGIVALLASYVPAWRATRVDPMTALRYE
jgi:predicted permease